MLQRNLLLSLLSAVLLSLPWYTPFSGLILLVAWLPLLLLEDGFSERRQRGCWKYYVLTFVVWNIITTYWIYKATLFGAIGAIIGNSLQMILIFALFRRVKRKAGKAVGYAFLVALWLAWEYFYFDAEISWPWLVLGNGFAKDIRLIQWYEYTGVLGGSLWVWSVNLALFAYLKYRLNRRRAGKLQAKNASVIFNRQGFIIHASLFILIFAPVVVSLALFYSYKEKEAPCNVVLVQPNIDPYNEKFGGMTAEKQLDIFLSLAAARADSTTDYVIGPETALSSVGERHFAGHPGILRLSAFAAQYPHLSVIIGATSFNTFLTDVAPSSTARKMEGGYYEVYNTALQIAPGNEVEAYHKSKLVIGAEKTPYPKYFELFSDYIIDLGGSVGAFGVDSVQKVFTRPGRPFKAGVAICYEGIYGRFYTNYIKQGANLMFIISNDGWWGNTGGYRQLLYQSSLRAIETRRSIARSANTGISAFIDQRGLIVERSQWWEPVALKGAVNTNDRITFYVRYGDYIGRTAVFVMCLLLLYTLTQWRKRSA